MGRCCWARRGNYSSQKENLQGVREVHPNDLIRLLATTCDTGCDTTCDSRKGTYSGAHRRDKDHIQASVMRLREATRGNLRGVIQ